MKWKFDNNQPLYIQLCSYLRTDIINGTYKSDEKLPSVRDFASQAEVNPNTMQRALNDIEAEGLIVTRGTNGKYVTSDASLIEKTKLRIIHSITEDYLSRLSGFGIDRIGAIHILNEMEGNS